MPFSALTLWRDIFIVIMPKEIKVAVLKISYLTNFFRSLSADQKKVLSRFLPYEGVNQNVIIHRSLFDANNHQLYLSAVSPAADEVQHPSM